MLALVLVVLLTTLAGAVLPPWRTTDLGRLLLHHLALLAGQVVNEAAK